jgi:hypothetical protein
MLIDAKETYMVEIPGNILAPVEGALQRVIIKPLDVNTFQLIAKAARDDHSLIPLLIIKESVIDPVLNINQIKGMKVGLVNFLIKEIKQVSGII